MDLREQIGQRLVTGFPGTELTEDFRRMVREYKISNVILFRENITDCAQLKQLCGEIQALVRRETGHGAFITADQEGGLVTRLPGDAVNVPGAMAIAATGDPENAYRAGLLTGRELRALGVNFDLAPSVDVNSNPENPVIGARSYGDTPQEVSRYANRMIRGLLDGGVLCSAKHFPGHGDTDTDSHLALPCVDKSMEELERTELLPFREAVRAGVPAVMTTHILFPQLEPEHLPATMSRRIMTGLLREQMGFDGLITVGPLSRHLASAAKEGGMTSVFSCDTCEEAAEKLAALAKAGDAVLVKGSHYMHMEKVPMLLRGVLTKDGK